MPLMRTKTGIRSKKQDGKQMNMHNDAINERRAPSEQKDMFNWRF
jgi:hypothetical protein